MRRRRTLTILVLGGAAALASGCGQPAESPTPTVPAVVTSAPTPTAAPVASPTSAPTPRPSAPALATPSVTPGPPSPTPGPKPTPTANVVIDSPRAGYLATGTVSVSGVARAFEAMLIIELVRGDISLAWEPVHASMGAPEWGTYSVILHYAQPAEPADALLRGYTLSAKDGSVRDLVEVPVRLAASATTIQPTSPDRYPLKLYFPRQSPDEMFFVAVEREVPRTPAVGRAALEEVLKGPTPQEEARGLFTPFAKDARLKSLSIVDGVARVDFDDNSLLGGGSVRIISIKRTVELALLQFSTVREVDITFGGKHDWSEP